MKFREGRDSGYGGSAILRRTANGSVIKNGGSGMVRYKAVAIVGGVRVEGIGDGGHRGRRRATGRNLLTNG